MRGIRRSQSAGYRINRQRDALDSGVPFAQVGNRTKIGPLRGENPVRSGFVILSWRRWNSQFNKLRRDWFVADRGQERSGFAMRQQRNLSGNHGMFGIFVIPFQSIRR